MKYGVLLNKSNINIGDDIQAYATARFLPSVDYFIDREHIDEFVTDDKKACAVIMNAWYMWAKWNWPPSKYIYPHFIGMHYADHQLALQVGTPVKYEFLQGIGGDYLKAYEPIGCRDKFTENQLKKIGIDSYFSGCITLTLPKMPETADKNSYMVLLDIEDKRVNEKIKNDLKNEDIEIREVSQLRKRDPEISWEDRINIVKERLTLYQNARCVVTKRLHAALPCLAMGVPVLLVKIQEDDIRFDPYYDWVHRCTVDDFLADKCDYDFLNPPENSDDYLPVRESLIKSATEFVEKTKTLSDDPDVLNPTTYTQQQVMQWRHDTMKKMMDVWLLDDREQLTESNRRLKKINALTAEKEKLKKTVEKKEERIQTLIKRRDLLIDKKEKLTEENKNLREQNEFLKKQLEIEKNRSLVEVIKMKVKKSNK